MDLKLILTSIFVITGLVAIFILYRVFRDKNRYSKIKTFSKFDDIKEYDIQDTASANAQLFELNMNRDSDLDKTQVFSPITQEHLEKYYNAEANLFDDIELPKLK